MKITAVEVEMNLEVNAYNVGQEFVRLLDITLDLQKDAPVSSADTLVAEYLLRKFAHYTVNYILLDEEENSDGGGKEIMTFQFVQFIMYLL